MRLITVVMKEDNTDNRTKDTIAMMDYGFNMYSVKNIISKGNKIGNIYINLGKEEYADISSLEDINIVNSNQDNEAKFTYEIETDNVTAPLSKGSVVGKITVYKDGKYFVKLYISGCSGSSCHSRCFITDKKTPPARGMGRHGWR